MTFSALWHNFFGFYGQFYVKKVPYPKIIQRWPPDYIIPYTITCCRSSLVNYVTVTMVRWPSLSYLWRWDVSYAKLTAESNKKMPQS